jgi:hypothetical protein
MRIRNSGSGAHAASLTLQIRAAAVPEASTWARMLLGFAGVGYLPIAERTETARLMQPEPPATRSRTATWSGA